LEENKGNIMFVGGGSKSTIKCLPNEDFPLLPAIPKDNKFTIHRNDLVSGIKSTIFSAAISNTKPEISSVYIYQEGKTITFVSTDSVRLAEKKMVAKKDDTFIPFILPLKTALEVLRVCEIDTTTQEVAISHNENQISFVFKDIQISSRLINGNFPDYRQIIPKTNTTEVVLLKQDLVGALKIANIFSDKFHKILFSIDPKQKQALLVSENPDIGKNETALSAAITGDRIDINFNQKNIVDCIGNIPQDSVALGFSGEGKPLIIRGVGDTSFTYLVAPLSS
jgi:DNA polymerase-3 subunit beta